MKGTPIAGAAARSSSMGSIRRTRSSGTPRCSTSSWRTSPLLLERRLEQPYIGRAPLEQGTWWQAGADAAGRLPVRAVDFSGEAAIDFAKYSNDYGSVQMWGARVQGGGVSIRTFELAVRYACLAPDSKFAYMTVPLTGSQMIQEITPSAIWFIRGAAARSSSQICPSRHQRPGLHRGRRRQLRGLGPARPGDHPRDDGRPDGEHGRSSERLPGAPAAAGTVLRRPSLLVPSSS